MEPVAERERFVEEEVCGRELEVGGSEVIDLKAVLDSLVFFFFFLVSARGKLCTSS